MALTVKTMVFPLAQQQESAFDVLTSNSIHHTVQRYCDYYVNVEEAQNKLIKSSFNAGMVVGGVLGVLSALFVLNQEEKDGENKYTEAVKVGGKAFVAGSFIGSLCGGGYTICTTSKSVPYFDWKIKAIREKIFPAFRTFLESSDLREFLCPISHDIILTPAKDPKGRVYEYLVIKQWIEQKSAEPEVDLETLPTEADRNRVRFRTSPFCDMALQIKDLTYDLDYHPKLAIVLKTLHEQEIDQQFKAGLFEYRVTILKDRKELMRAVIEGITKKHVEGHLSEAEFLRLVKSCKEHYELLV